MLYTAFIIFALYSYLKEAYIDVGFLFYSPPSFTDFYKILDLFNGSDKMWNWSNLTLGWILSPRNWRLTCKNCREIFFNLSPSHYVSLCLCSNLKLWHSYRSCSVEEQTTMVSPDWPRGGGGSLSNHYLTRSTITLHKLKWKRWEWSFTTS